MTKTIKGRQIIRTRSTAFGEYPWDPENTDISMLNLSYDHTTGQGSYIMRMEPGAVTEVHTHKFNEEYFIIEGDLVEPDGTVLGPGDMVIFKPGTEHNSQTVNGCLLIAIDYP